MPYGALPIIHIDGNVSAQSDAILRYAGRLAGLYPEDPLEALYVDEVLDVCADLYLAMYRNRDADEEGKRKSREKAAKEDVPRYWGGLEKRLDAISNGNGPYVLGDKITIADIKITIMYNNVKCGVLDYFPVDALDGYSKLVKIYSTVMALPKVAEWYKKYPIPNVTS